MVDIVFHVGMIKTGTTFLQNEIFNRIAEVNLIRRNHNLLRVVDINKINIVSDENLAGTIDDNTRFKILENIFSMFPNAKIIYGVRDIESFKRSAYSQYVRTGGKKSFASFLSMLDSDLYDFDRYIAQFSKYTDDYYIYRYEDLRDNPDKVVRGICRFLDVGIPDYRVRVYKKGLSDFQILVCRISNYFVRGVMGKYFSKYNSYKANKYK